MDYLIVIFILSAGLVPVKAQHHRLDHYNVAITTLHINRLFGSFAGLFVKDFHPGIEVSTGFKWQEKKNHNWYQEFQLGYSYQRWVQHSISLYTSVGYRYLFPVGFFADLAIGAGYLQAIPDSKVFKLQDDGSYKKKINLGRPQAMAAVGITAGKSFRDGKSIFLKYQQRLQTPFIRSYVPVLPANMMQAGITIPLHRQATQKSRL